MLVRIRQINCKIPSFHKVRMRAAAEIWSFKAKPCSRLASSFQETFVILDNCFNPAGCFYDMPADGRNC